MSRSDAPTTKVYVGKLPEDAKKEEVEAAFERFGKLQDVWVARNPPGFAFVEFYDSRDARDAVRELDGRNMCGARVIVELSHGRGKGSSRGGRGRPPFRDRYDRQDNRGRYGGRDDRDDRRYDRYRDNSREYQRPRGRGSPGRSRSPSPGGRY